MQSHQVMLLNHLIWGSVFDVAGRMYNEKYQLEVKKIINMRKHTDKVECHIFLYILTRDKFFLDK